METKTVTPEDVESLIRQFGGQPTGPSAAPYDILMTAIRSVFAERDALQARLEVASRNERRYLWLRSSESSVAEVCNKATLKADGFVFMEGDELDAAIDAAIAQEQGKPMTEDEKIAGRHAYLMDEKP
jgi:hypothetical protein